LCYVEPLVDFVDGFRDLIRLAITIVVEVEWYLRKNTWPAINEEHLPVRCIPAFPDYRPRYMPDYLDLTAST
jgi:hypothetical protein